MQKSRTGVKFAVQFHLCQLQYKNSKDGVEEASIFQEVHPHRAVDASSGKEEDRRKCRQTLKWCLSLGSLGSRA